MAAIWTMTTSGVGWTFATFVLAVAVQGPPSVHAQEPPQPTAATSATSEESVPEPPAIGRGIDLAERALDRSGDEPRDGFYLDMGAMATGAGIAAGPGYRRGLFGRRALADASAAYSWRGYKGVRARFEWPTLVNRRLMAGVQYRWQDVLQTTYFGDGPASLESARSEYRLTAHDIVGYTRVRLATAWSLRARMGWLRRPTLRAPAGHFMRGFPSTLEVFPTDAAATRRDQPSYWLGDLSVVFDRRDQAGYPRRGGFYRAAWVTANDREDNRFSSHRYELEAAQFRPLASDRIVVALHAWSAMTSARPDRVVPFYLLPSLGGNNTLRGFHNYRFHDRHMVVANVEARVALFPRLDVAAFMDAGSVAQRVRQLNLDRTSFGGGLRLHSARSTLARLDVARSREGWRVIVTRSDPLNLARRSIRAAIVPFVP